MTVPGKHFKRSLIFWHRQRMLLVRGRKGPMRKFRLMQRDWTHPAARTRQVLSGRTGKSILTLGCPGLLLENSSE